MLDYPVPNPLNGEGLRAELAAAGVTVDPDAVFVDRGRLIFATLGEADATAVDPVVQAHTGQPTAERQAELDRHDNLAGAISTLRQWADDAAGVTVSNTNNTQVTQVMVDRLGVFFDRFADLLENRY